MGRFTRISLPHRQALNATLVYTSRAPEKARRDPAAYLRALRVELRMSQAVLARRAGMTQAQIDRLEKGRADARLGTWRRVFEAMFCELLVVPLARRRPGDAVAEQRLSRAWARPWSSPDRLGR
jgi:DNA-binding XRE family transcriptional regulator